VQADALLLLEDRANQVKAILRFCEPDQAIATRYAHYM